MQKAIDLNRPACQDTGRLCSSLKSVPASHCLASCKHTQTSRGRGNRQSATTSQCVEIFDEVNTGKNTGSGVPWVPGTSSPTMTMRKSKFTWQAGLHATWPLESVNAVRRLRRRVKFVFENISTLAVNACPPVLWAWASPPRWKPPPYSRVKPFAPDWQPPSQSKSGRTGATPEEGLNRLGIGPQGLTGNSSVWAYISNLPPAIRQPSALLSHRLLGASSRHAAGSCRSHL